MSFHFAAEGAGKWTDRTEELSDLEISDIQTSPLSGYSVLIVDDSRDTQALTRRILTKNGAEVDVAENGAEALKLALDKTYDAILMDVQMPILDGYEATRFLRGRGYRKPIVALTAHAMAEEKRRTRAAGYDAHITKPINQALLVRTIEALAERSSQ